MLIVIHCNMFLGVFKHIYLFQVFKHIYVAGRTINKLWMCFISLNRQPISIVEPSDSCFNSYCSWFARHRHAGTFVTSCLPPAFQLFPTFLLCLLSWNQRNAVFVFPPPPGVCLIRSRAAINSGNPTWRCDINS